MSAERREGHQLLDVRGTRLDAVDPNRLRPSQQATRTIELFDAIGAKCAGLEDAIDRWDYKNCKWMANLEDHEVVGFCQRLVALQQLPQM